MPFKTLSSHHVNMLAVTQCSHLQRRVMLNDVDVAVDAQSDLRADGRRDTKWETTKPLSKNTIPVSLAIPTKQTKGEISGNIYSIWVAPGNHTGVFVCVCFFGGFGDTNRRDNSSPCLEGTRQFRSCPRRWLFISLSTVCDLAAGRILRLFSQSWQKNTGKWVDPATLTKSGAGSARVPCLSAELHCCGGRNAGRPQKKAQRLNSGSSRLIPILWHCAVISVGIVILNYCVLEPYFLLSNTRSQTNRSVKFYTTETRPGLRGLHPTNYLNGWCHHTVLSSLHKRIQLFGVQSCRNMALFSMSFPFF